MMDIAEGNLKHLGISEREIRDSKILADAGHRNNDHIGKLNRQGYDMYIRVNPKNDNPVLDKIGTEECGVLKKCGKKLLVCPGGRELTTKGVNKRAWRLCL